MDHTARNFILQLRRLQFGKVTQGHTAGQLNRQHLISGFLILSSVFYTLLSSLIGYQTSLFVWDSPVLKLKASRPRKSFSHRQTSVVSHLGEDTNYYSYSYHPTLTHNTLINQNIIIIVIIITDYWRSASDWTWMSSLWVELFNQFHRHTIPSCFSSSS